MTSTIKVDKLDPQSGTALEIGTSGDTVTVPSGVGLTLTDATLLLPTTVTATTEVKTNKISPATGTAFALGDSGDTFTVPSGATIVNSGTATGFGGGKILQVVGDTLTSEYTTSSTSWSDTGLTLAITPAATSSKILILVQLSNIYTNTTSQWITYTIDRGGSNLGNATYGLGGLVDHEDGRIIVGDGVVYLDSPSSTSELTYKIQGRLVTASGAGQISQNSTTSSLVAMEIGA